MHIAVTLFCLFGITSAVSANPILRKLDSELRFQYVQDDATGQHHLADFWMSLSDLNEAARYVPDAQNIYHLFTRQNPTVSHPLVINNEALLGVSSYSNNRRTIVLLHGWLDNALSPFNNVLVPAILQAEDANVIVVDWSAGAGSINYATAMANTITSADSVARFINWLNRISGTMPVQYHIIGHGLGGHKAGIVGRRVDGTITYITEVDENLRFTALDPSMLGWINHSDRFQPTDALYTEVIHTNAGVNGYVAELGDVDFYPNGGELMPGCESHACDHARSYFYMAESIISGGFTGTQCTSYLTAILQTCSILPGRLQMGGLQPKIGSSGVYLLFTNAAPPFSLG
ncbi:Pancreatic triacylglycerol lipase [Eumeta japonica]|uniref:Pancreatic triacylglycerol lipase n=1 Tax=Eumeta variegata TaxID=151549 RepID=A0A4C1TIS0_EUMVA|nr:Pancreatic triacylglycerol lipase [Eumeta japonica]